MSFDEVLGRIDDVVWGIPLIVFILFVGIFLTVRLRGVQFVRFSRALKYVFRKEKNAKHGEVSSFGALCTALSATIGTGNIVGVATAIVAGGPGALFWMWVAALLGTATKFTECMLAVKFREVSSDNHILGGPFYYIEKGMGKNWKWLAKLFALLGTLAGLLGIGTFTQINGITTAIGNFFDPDMTHTFQAFGNDYSYSVAIGGFIIAVCAALVIIGGLKRISRVAEFIVPLMAAFYIIAALVIIFTHISVFPAAIAEIVSSAFGLRAASGGALGAMMLAMQKGIARGIFSNEAGLGSAPIAASAAHTDEPVRQGLVSMLGTVIDTIVICTMTGLCIVMMQTWNIGLEGVNVTTEAFKRGLPFPGVVSAFILMIALIFFAFTTILGWNYYSERCLEYLTNGNKKILKAFRWVYLFFVFIGPYMTVRAVWTSADIFNGLMAIPNLIALLALSGIAASSTKDYFRRFPKADHS